MSEETLNPITPGGLALRRRVGEGIVIILDGKVCEVNLIRFHRGEMVIQIKAPKEVKVIRRELLRQGNGE